MRSDFESFQALGGPKNVGMREMEGTWVVILKERYMDDWVKAVDSDWD